MLSEKEQLSDLHAFESFLKNNYLQLAVFCAIGGLMAFIITIYIPKEYKSYGIVYPPSSTSIENSIDYPNFGYDVEADRLMQILESTEIRDSVIQKFNLQAHFEIDTTSVAWRDELFKKYHKNIKLERTTSMAVLITARTKDAVLSANIVNTIINSADRFREKLYKRNIIPAYNQALAEYEIQKQKTDSMEHFLQKRLQDNKLSSLLLLMSDAQININLDKLSDAASYEGIGEQIIAFKSQYEVMKEAKNRMIKTKKTLQNPIPGIYVVNYGEPHFKKISPSYLINTCIGAIAGLLITVLLLLIRKRSGVN